MAFSPGVSVLGLVSGKGATLQGGTFPLFRSWRLRGYEWLSRYIHCGARDLSRERVTFRCVAWWRGVSSVPSSPFTVLPRCHRRSAYVLGAEGWLRRGEPRSRQLCRCSAVGMDGSSVPGHGRTGVERYGLTSQPRTIILTAAFVEGRSALAPVNGRDGVAEASKMASLTASWMMTAADIRAFILVRRRHLVAYASIMASLALVVKAAAVIRSLMAASRWCFGAWASNMAVQVASLLVAAALLRARALVRRRCFVAMARNMALLAASLMVASALRRTDSVSRW